MARPPARRVQSRRDDLFLMIGGGGAVGGEMMAGAIATARNRFSGAIILRQNATPLANAESPDLKGIILGQVQYDLLESLRGRRFPVINLSNAQGALAGVGNVLSDDPAVGGMAAEYLLGLRHRRFLVVATQDSVVHAERAVGFAATVRAAGGTVERVDLNFRARQETGEGPHNFYHRMREQLTGPIGALPLGSAIFATNDEVALIVLQLLKLEYPELLDTTAVLGVDNNAAHDRYLGYLPEVSSIVPAFHAMGAAAMAWLLDHPGPQAIEQVCSLDQRFPPVQVVARASTATGRCADPLTARMIRWAWERVQRQEEVSVAAMARAHRLNRKTLERRFAQHGTSSPGDMILQLRLDQARELLRSTRLSIAEISEACGYSKQDVLSRAIRRAHGCTPREFRLQQRRG